jgi:hypothetical protein
MKTITQYVAEDGKLFDSKNDCMNHNIDLIDWSEFKGVYWLNFSVNDFTDNFKLKLIPFEKIEYGVTLFSMLRKPNSYLYIPNEELANVFKSYRNYFYDTDKNFISELTYGINYISDNGDSICIKNLNHQLNELRKNQRIIEKELNQLEQVIDKVESRVFLYGYRKNLT